MVINCKKPCKRKRSTMLTVEQMVDIALGTPEIGAVNFNVLHALIHVIIQRLNIQKCLVEFKGYDSDRMEGIILTAKPGPILKLSEYMVDGADGKPCPPKEKVFKEGEEDKEEGKDGKEGKEGKEGREGRKPICECVGKRKKPADDEKTGEKEKTEKKEGTESEQEEKKGQEKKSVRVGSNQEDCEDVEEPQPKKVREVKKPCPCRVNKDQDTILADESLKRVPSSYYGSDGEVPCHTIVRVEPVGERCDSWRSRPALAHESMIKLEEKVAMLQDAFEALEQMPTNEELKKRAQGGQVSTPVKDLWQIYNLNKRVESCEGTIEKLASMIEDLVKETCNFREAMIVVAGAVDDIQCGEQTLINCGAVLQGHPQGVVKKKAGGDVPSIAFKECDGKPCEQEDDKNKAPASAPSEHPSPRSSVTQPTEKTSRKHSVAPVSRMSIAPSEKRHSTTQGPVTHRQSVAQFGLSQRQSVTAGAMSHRQSGLSQRQSMAQTSTPPTQSGGGVPRSGSETATAAEQGPSAESAPQPPEQTSSDGPSKTPAPDTKDKEKEGTTPQGPVNFPEVHETRQSEAPVSKTQAASHSAAQPQNFAAEVRGPLPVEAVGIGPEFFKMSVGEKFCVLKEYIDCLSYQVRQLSDSFPLKQITSKLCAVASMQKQLDSLEKEWRDFLSHYEQGGVDGFIQEFKNMKQSVDTMTSSISKIKAEKAENETQLKVITQETSYLKRVKADLEMVEDLLAEKADTTLVNRKVSHDQFDAACDDLTRGLDEALEKLLQQEVMWNEAMEEIQNSLDNKLDKVEIMPLKEFINKKLTCLQEKLRQLGQLRKVAEAAGAKSRILRNLNCIACDGDVIMKMDNRSGYPSPSLAPSKSLKPMLTYELDQVRKAMKKGPPCRAPTTHAEEVLMDAQKKEVGIPLTQGDAVRNKMNKFAHFCNRYCGGSHTITTPQQRVTRIGHFLTEFGPQAIAMFNQDYLDTKSNHPTSEALTSDADLRKPC